MIYRQVSWTPSIDIVECNQCKHVFSLIKDKIDSEAIYRDEVYEVVENRQSVFDKILNIEYHKVLDQLANMHRSQGRLLDFGSGKGKFGSLAKNRGWQVKCVETSAARADYASSVYGLDVNRTYYSSGNIFNTEFDVLTLFHVVEHLPKPFSLLKELIKFNLTADALIIMEVPNFNSYQSKMSREKWIHLDVPRHISHFTAERMQVLVDDLELSIIKTSFFSLHLGILGMLDSLLKKFGYRGNLIYQLKSKRTPKLVLAILLLTPFAFILEGIAALNGKGGIIRYYLRRKRKP